MGKAAASDVSRYKEDIRKEWTDPETVSAWRRWYPHLTAFTAAITEKILEAADFKRGMKVLDLASGTGDPALAVAGIVGPEGHVTATDIGADMLAAAEEYAAPFFIITQAAFESLPSPKLTDEETMEKIELD